MSFVPISVCWISFFCQYSATTEIYTDLHTLSLHDALPISVLRCLQWRAATATHHQHRVQCVVVVRIRIVGGAVDRCHDAEHADPRSEEHTYELQSLMRITYAVFCLNINTHNRPYNITII